MVWPSVSKAQGDFVMSHTGANSKLARPRALVTTARLPFISVIVPVRNEESFLGHTLTQLAVQNYDRDRFEVLVADGESTDGTRAVVAGWAARYSNIHLVPNPNRWSSAGRNAAIAMSQGEIIALVDGHCELDNANYLRELADAFARSGAECVGRPQPLDVSCATALQRAIALGRCSRLGHHPSSHIYSNHEGFVLPQSVATAYRREVFTLVGLFDERFDACEDVEFNHRVARAGMPCFFTPKVQVRYHPRSTLSGLYRQLVRYGRGRVRLLRKHPDSFSVPGFVPAIWASGLVGGLVAAAFSQYAAVAYVTCLAIYGICVLGFSVGLGWRERSLVVTAWLPLVYVTIHLGAATGLLWEMAIGRRLSRYQAEQQSSIGAASDILGMQPRRDVSRAA
jgi:succinoglycan biosynthesis protein ExoA